VTASKKILLAATIIAIGYGFATLLGSPAGNIADRSPPPAPPADPQSIAGPYAPATHAPASDRYGLPAARLIPDNRPLDIAKLDTAAHAPSSAEQLKSRHFELSKVGESLAEDNEPPALFTRPLASPTKRPRATLRDEAPRALAREPRAPVTVKHLEPAASANAPSLFAAEPPASMTAHEVRDFAVPGAARPVGYETAPRTSPGDNAVAPEPLPTRDDYQEPRTHIIIDGDSLARLAGRYLDDPHRADEIFQLNRHLLSSPDLLPIGAEISIPSRVGRATIRQQSPRSALPRALASHAPASGGLVPVRPVPSATGLVPRAQLARPLPAP